MIKRYLIRFCICACWTLLILFLILLPESKFFSQRRRTLNIFAWGDALDTSLVSAFEREKKVKVNLNYYTSNEELLVKMRATKGKGYDLIVPSDYAVDQLRREKLLQPIDKSQLHFYSSLNPNLLNHYYDPGNRYSVPFTWEIFLLGIDTSYFKNGIPEASWNLIFDTQNIPSSIVMLNDPIMGFLITNWYINGKKASLTKEDVTRVRDTLIQQKKFVSAYVDFRADYYLYSKNSPIALSLSSYIPRANRKHPHLGILIPKEGTFITIENLAIPVQCKRPELAYEFINFFYKTSSIKTQWESFSQFPAITEGLDDLYLSPEEREILLFNQSEFKNFQFTNFPISRDEMRELWIQLKS